LAKPRFIRKGTIKDLASDYLTPFDFSSFFSLIEIVTKIFNYTGMRFTMCAKLTLNVTPFDSGCVVLSYTPPFYVERAIDAPLVFTYSQVPHSEANISETSSLELRVPFYSPLRYLQTQKLLLEDYLGAFHVVSPLSDIFAGNSSEYRLYFWIEDVELLYPTNLLSDLKSWTPQGPEEQKIKGGQVVLSQPYYDSNIGITAQAVPYCMNAVSKEYSMGATDSFYELFSIPCISQKFTAADVQIIEECRPFAPHGLSKLSLCNQFFMMYSGSINYRLKIFKTKFHSGRMQIAFLPMWEATTPIPTDLSDFWNIIWDYRESSEIEFSIPYVHPAFVTRTGVPQGRLVMKQIVPLQAPDNVAQNPVIVLEHWAGDDFRVLAPQPVQDMNFLPVTASSVGWTPQGPSISDKPVPTPDNYVNESDCTIPDFVTKYSGGLASNATDPGPGHVGLMASQWIAGGIFVPTSIAMRKFVNNTTNTSVSNIWTLANIFQFYRGDLTYSDVMDATNFKATYTQFDSLGSNFPVVPYVGNLRYNEVSPSGPAELKARIRLHKARFFYPWYPCRAQQY
jgi:hypothetical protein